MNKYKTSLAFCILFGVVLIALTCYHLRTAYLLEESRTRDQVSNVTNLVAEWMKRSMLNTDYVLRDIVSHIEPEQLKYPATDPAAQRQITAFIIGKKNTLPGAFGVGLTGKDCIVTHTSAVIGIDVSQREWCQELMRSPATESFVSHLYLNKSGRPAVNQVRRFPSPEGKFAGLAGISVDLGFFSEWLKNVTLDRHGIILMADTSLNLLASNSSTVGVPGQRLNAVTLQRFIESGQDYLSIHAAALGDTTQRLYGIRKVEKLPFLIVYGAADEDWQANWRRQVVVELAAFLLIAGMTIVMLRAYWNQLRQEDRLQLLANTDGLTGVANRRHFFERAGWELRKAKRSQQLMALMIVDIDNFKAINDQYGHPAGDQAVVLFAEACKCAIRQVDLLGRFGGDEFIVLLPATGLDDAVTIAERLRGLIAASTALQERGIAVDMSASIGVSLIHPDDADLSQALNKADVALYRAKQLGRNRVELES